MPFADGRKPYHPKPLAERPPPPPIELDGTPEGSGPAPTPPVYQDPVMCSRHDQARAVAAISTQAKTWRLMCQECLALWNRHHGRRGIVHQKPLEEDEPPF